MALFIACAVIAGQFALAGCLAYLGLRRENRSAFDDIRKLLEGHKTILTNHADSLLSQGQALAKLQQERTKRALGG